MRAILEGSVRKAATRLRITVQLVDPKNGYQLWSERYDRELADVFEIQDDIARRIVEALEVRLVSGEFSGRRDGGARDANAFDLYLKGMNFFYRGTRRDFEFAQELFRKSIALDGRYASPWAGIADCNSQIFREFDRRPQYLEEARAAAARALELDPGSAPAHTSLGFALSLAGQRAAAEEAFQKALQLDPRLFEACYLYASEMLYGWGDLERAAALFERASEVDRNDYQSPIILASVYLGLGRPADALGAARRGLQIARARLQLHPGNLRALYMSAQALAVLGENQEAIDLAQRARELDGDRTGLVLDNVAAAARHPRQEGRGDRLSRAGRRARLPPRDRRPLRSFSGPASRRSALPRSSRPDEARVQHRAAPLPGIAAARHRGTGRINGSRTAAGTGQPPGPPMRSRQADR